MQRFRWYGPTFVVLGTVLFVMLAGPGMIQRLAWAQKDAQITLVRNELTGSRTLAEMSNDFRKVGQVVEPSVVHIQVYHKGGVTVSRFSSPTLPEELQNMFPELRDLQRRRNAQPQQPNDPQLDRYNVPEAVGAGSGWVYDTLGHIITNHHVIEDADKITVRFHDGSERSATVVGTDDKTDIAVLKVTGSDLHPATLATEPVQQGDIVFAFGSPLRLEFSMSMGIVSAKGRHVGILRESSGYEDFIQTDAAINPGNSGGPLTNTFGQVVGMNSAIASSTGYSNGVGFAIPIDMIKDVAENILKSGKVNRAYLGIYIDDLDSREAKTFGYDGKGVLVIRTPIKDGPAEKAGILRGDIITRVEDKSVSTADELRNTVSRLPIGKSARIELFRKGKTEVVNVTLTELPPDSVAVAPSRPTNRPDQGSSEQASSLLRKLGMETVSNFVTRPGDRQSSEFTAGVLVDQMRPQSIAASVMIPGCVITEVQDVAITTVDDLNRELLKHQDRQTVRLTVAFPDTKQLRYLPPQFVFLDMPRD